MRFMNGKAHTFCGTLLPLLALLLFALPAVATDAKPDTTARYAKQLSQWKFEYVPLRVALHNKIVEARLRAGTIDDKPRLIFTAGPFGAGKSFVTSALQKLNLLDVEQFLWIDPDSLKEEIPDYEDFKKKDPENAATLVHRESGHIQEQLFEEALKMKKNIIVDGSLRGKSWWESEFKRIRKSYPDYSISIISISAPHEVLLERVDARGKVTGRYIPHDLVLKSAAEVRDSVNYLSNLTDLTLEIENGITPTLKAIKVKGEVVPTHFDLSGQLGGGAKALAEAKTPLLSREELLAEATKASHIVVVAGHGPLGYENFQLLNHYIFNTAPAYRSDALYVLSHQKGIGRAGNWLLSRAHQFRHEIKVAAASRGSDIEALFADPALRVKAEVLSLKGETQEVHLIETALAHKVPVTLVRNTSLNPEAEAVAFSLTKNPHFDADPTRIFENGRQEDALRVIRSLEIPEGDRLYLYDERTQRMRALYRQLEKVSDAHLMRTVIENFPEMILMTEGTVATAEAQAETQKLSQVQELPKELMYLNSKDHLFPVQMNPVPEKIGTILSSTLYGKAYAEYDRTVSALLLFKRLINGDYEGFVQGQPMDIRLSQEHFLEISKQVRKVAYNAAARDALFSFIVLNHVGKSQAVASYLSNTSGIQETNHQRVMAKVLKLYPFISPTFRRLDEIQRRLVLSGFEKEFNLAQLVQGEAPVRALMQHGLRTEEEKDLYLAISLLKIASARGQDAVVGSLVMTQPTYEGIRAAMKVISGMKGTEESVTNAYREFMLERGRTLLPQVRQSEVWLTRLCLLFRCQNPKDGLDLTQALAQLSTQEQNILRREFSATGFKRDPAILPYSAPAMLSNLRKALPRDQYFVRGMQLLSAAMQAAREEAQRLGASEVLQVRLDVLAKQIRDNNSIPSNLDIEIYEDHVFGLSARMKIVPPNCPGALSQ